MIDRIRNEATSIHRRQSMKWIVITIPIALVSGCGGGADSERDGPVKLEVGGEPFVPDLVGQWQIEGQSPECLWTFQEDGTYQLQNAPDDLLPTDLIPSIPESGRYDLLPTVGLPVEEDGNIVLKYSDTDFGLELNADEPTQVDLSGTRFDDRSFRLRVRTHHGKWIVITPHES